MNILQKTILLSSLFLTSCALAKVFYPNTEVNNPLFIFDVGSVLVNQSQLSNAPAYFDIFKQSDKKGKLSKVGLWCSYNFSKLGAMNNQLPEDAVIDYIAYNYPVLNEMTDENISLADQIKEAYCLATPIKETQQVVADLIKKEYPVALGSNKGKNTIARMIKSGALANLDYVTIFTCDSHEQAADGIYFKKPNAQYYELLKADLYNKGFVHNTFIFIDNKLANVEAACKAGMIGILYTTYAQFVADLEQLGITLP